MKALNTYQKSEEFLNVITHGIGLILSFIALFFLLFKSLKADNNIWLINSLVYGFSLIFLYTSSTFYHASHKPALRNKLNVMDHLAIYILIAGTYTPFTMITLSGTVGWIIFSTVWLSALTGIILKLYFFGKYNTLSAIAYVVMGWIIVVAIRSLIENLGIPGTIWLFAGGVFYSVGAGIYLWKKLPFNHAIFHVFVLAGSACHFVAIYNYVLI